jgi:hypothetical protein
LLRERSRGRMNRDKSMAPHRCRGRGPDTRRNP